MQTVSSNLTFSQRLHRASASARFFTVSLLIHIVIIISCGSAVMFQQMSAPPDFLAGGDMGLVDEGVAASLPKDEPATPKLDATPTAPAGPSTPGIDAIATSAVLNQSLNVGTLSPNQVVLGTAARGANGDALAKALSDGIGKATDGMARNGGTQMVKFFGKTTMVQSIVFVVDISGSMVSGEKNAKTYDDLEDEVKRVIRSLDRQTQFGLVAFSGDAYFYRSELVPATNDEKQRAINWLKKQSPVGTAKTTDEEEKKKHHGTRADKGLEAAFNLKADTIFFVSDGEPTGANPAQVLKLVEEWQKGRPKPAVINAVAYLADSGQKFMQDLAKKTAGTFREINPRDARDR